MHSQICGRVLNLSSFADDLDPVRRLLLHSISLRHQYPIIHPHPVHRLAARQDASYDFAKCQAAQWDTRRTAYTI